MSSCLSGAGGRTYGFDFEFVKSPSSSTRTSQTSSSPSSTISESSNSPLALSTRKPRTPRKRPNQTYNEAAALLSTAYPNLFSTKNPKPSKFTKSTSSSFDSHTLTTTPFLDESSELFLPFRAFDSSSFLLHHPIEHKPKEVMLNLQTFDKPCQSPGEISSRVHALELEDEPQEDFDAESILDEEIEEIGIDSIMGTSNDAASNEQVKKEDPWMGFGGKLDFRLGMRKAGVRAMRHADDGNWWNLPAVDIHQISPKICVKPTPPPPTAAAVEKKKKKKKVEKSNVVEVSKNAELPKESDAPKSNQGLMLKLDFDDVRNAWSDRGSPFADDSPCSDVPGNDVTARLSQIDLLWDNGGVREASVQRYKEKRRTRLFSKKIRYQVRKVNADRRPRMKGRFVRRPNSSSNTHSDDSI